MFKGSWRLQVFDFRSQRSRLDRRMVGELAPFGADTQRLSGAARAPQRASERAEASARVRVTFHDKAMLLSGIPDFRFWTISGIPDFWFWTWCKNLRHFFLHLYTIHGTAVFSWKICLLGSSSLKRKHQGSHFKIWGNPPGVFMTRIKNGSMTPLFWVMTNHF